MEAAERWGRGESKLTRRVKCQELSPWGPGGLEPLGSLEQKGLEPAVPYLPKRPFT